MKILKFLVLVFFVVFSDGYSSNELDKESKFLFVPLALGGVSTTTCNSQYSWASALRLVCTGYFKCIVSKGILVGTCNSGTHTCCGYKNKSKRKPPSPPIVTPTTSRFKNDIPATSASHTINQIDSTYCTVRIDFVEFSIEQPDATGHCLPTGVMTVTPANIRRMPDLCGENQGQHVYQDFPASGRIVIDINTLSPGSRWDLKITQIPCGSQAAAPRNCLQYFRSSAGLIESFNFPGSAYNPQKPAYQLADTNYDICLGDTNACSQVDLERNSIYAYSFTVSGPVSSAANPIGSTQTMETGLPNCTDYIRFEGLAQYPSTPGSSGVARTFCGLGFPDGSQLSLPPSGTGGTVQYPAVPPGQSPFVITVVTDNGEVPRDDGNAGFSLEYTLTCP